MRKTALFLLLLLGLAALAGCGKAVPIDRAASHTATAESAPPAVDDGIPGRHPYQKQETENGTIYSKWGFHFELDKRFVSTETDWDDAAQQFSYGFRVKKTLPVTRLYVYRIQAAAADAAACARQRENFVEAKGWGGPDNAWFCYEAAGLDVDDETSVPVSCYLALHDGYCYILEFYSPCDAVDEGKILSGVGWDA
ncbi:MAG: hypothetical protein II776_02785 [Clostridia bacterium]|nr:hypothetical protein [Clostridia bacterium]